MCPISSVRYLRWVKELIGDVPAQLVEHKISSINYALRIPSGQKVCDARWERVQDGNKLFCVSYPELFQRLFQILRNADGITAHRVDDLDTQIVVTTISCRV